MKTDDLIRTLAADPPARGLSIPTMLALAALGGLAVSIGIYLAAIGPREDIAAAARTLRFLLKPAETLLLATLAALALLRLVQPGAPWRRATLLIAVVPAVAAIAVVAELIAVPRAQWSERLIGDNISRCLTLIPLLALAPLAAFILALRQSAPTNPSLAGAAAGLLAGGLAATLYATHCTDDSPLFVAAWYSIAIAGVAALGALIGARWLRW
jgi:hypothetical protein